MKNEVNLRGLGVALVTPFNREGEVDFPRLQQLVDDVIQHKANYVVALGTTSESPTLTQQEKHDVVRTIVNTVDGRVPVVMGCGGPSTRVVIDKLTHADLSGISAILSVTPYYNRPSQEGLKEHYREIAYRSPLPIILYNIWKRTACNIEADTTLFLANEYDNIIGIKEASGNMNQIMKVVKHRPAGFWVISGDDAITLPLLAAGVDGLISVVANAFPAEVSQMVNLGLNNRFPEARKIHEKLLDITQACFKEGNPAGIKAVLALQEKLEYYLRLPLVRVSAEHQQYIKNLMENL
ncbi:MAG: 4-hydroxy-tetrahydrodipicolinate synthase [Bacteroidales bacterium]|nr:4-hydroxy-tetrahydrodipicolinate synthase [Bacteroidales bacterium]